MSRCCGGYTLCGGGRHVIGCLIVSLLWWLYTLWVPLCCSTNGCGHNGENAGREIDGQHIDRQRHWQRQRAGRFRSQQRIIVSSSSIRLGDVTCCRCCLGTLFPCPRPGCCTLSVSSSWFLPLATYHAVVILFCVAVNVLDLIVLFPLLCVQRTHGQMDSGRNAVQTALRTQQTAAETLLELDRQGKVLDGMQGMLDEAVRQLGAG